MSSSAINLVSIKKDISAFFFFFFFFKFVYNSSNKGLTKVKIIAIIIYAYLQFL